MNPYLLRAVAADGLGALPGQPLDPSLRPYIQEATPDNIRHWAYGTGDRNSLWLSESRARATRWGSLLAPPAMLFAFSRLSTGYIGGVPGVDALLLAVDCRFARPVRAGERVAARAAVQDAVATDHGVRYTLAITFSDADGNEIGSLHPTTLRLRERPPQTGDVAVAQWNAETLGKVAEVYDRERVTDLAWSSFAVGDELPTIVRGPTTTTTAIAFARGFGGHVVLAHGAWYERLASLPTLGEANAQGVPEPLERVRWDPDFARRHGLPTAIDDGPERVAWLANMVTNWLGAGGTLRRLTVELVRPAFLGDATWLSGTVTAKTEAGGERTAELALQARDQRDEITARATAVVALLPE